MYIGVDCVCCESSGDCRGECSIVVEAFRWALADGEVYGGVYGLGLGVALRFVTLRYASQGTPRLTASAVSKKNFHNSKTISLQSNLAGLVWRQSH